ncbi:unnamed protein product [Lepidochelys olivacea]
MLWHCHNTLSLAPRILARLQRMAVEFFWPELHWVSSGVLSLPLEEGRQGLVCLCSQVHVFRLQALQRLLFGAGSPAWSTLVHAFLRRLQGLRYDQQLFFLHLRGLPRDLSKLLVFYQDLLQTWKLFSATRSFVATEGADLLAEPLLHNLDLRVQVAESPSVCQRLVLETSWTTTGGTGWSPAHSDDAWGFQPFRPLSAYTRFSRFPTASPARGCSPPTPHPWPSGHFSWVPVQRAPQASPLPHSEPAAYPAAGPVSNRAQKPSLHTRSPYTALPHPRVPPQHYMVGLSST